MKVLFQRALAAAVPAALVAGTALSAGANTVGRPAFGSFIIRPAVTATTVLGGGATLPIPAYLGGSESTGSTNVGKAGSLFGYFATQSGGLNVEYCATGSGKGKAIFGGVANTVDIPCSNDASGSTATTYGFLPPGGSPRQTYPTVTGSDAPLTQSDYTMYTSDHAAPLEPVELPSVFGSIAIVYHDNALSASATRITLTNAQICGVYNGSITTYGALLGRSDTTKIVPVYRSDGSGTSFNFSNHLATVCSGFNGNQTFTTADPKLPAGAVGASGNSGVLAAVTATNGGFGYVEAGYIADAPSGTGPMNYANVKNDKNGVVYSPFGGLPAAANTVGSSSLLTNVQVVQGTGPAQTAALTGVRSGSCVKVVAPAAYANVSAGYPIVAVTYLLTNSAGNGSAGATALRLLETDLGTPGNFKGASGAHIFTIDEAGVATGTTGYSSLNGTFGTTIKATANSCINS